MAYMDTQHETEEHPRYADWARCKKCGGQPAAKAVEERASLALERDKPSRRRAPARTGLTNSRWQPATSEPVAKRPGERMSKTKLGYSHMTKKVYLLKGNGQREDWTQHFLGFCDEAMPLKDETVQDIADALGLTLPPERTIGQHRIKDGA